MKQQHNTTQHSSYIRKYIYAYVTSINVCVHTQRERESGGEGARERERDTLSFLLSPSLSSHLRPARCARVPTTFELSGSITHEATIATMGWETVPSSLIRVMEQWHRAFPQPPALVKRMKPSMLQTCRLRTSSKCQRPEADR